MNTNTAMKYRIKSNYPERGLLPEVYSTKAEAAAASGKVPLLHCDETLWIVPDRVSVAAAALGRRGGSAKSPAKQEAARENGKRGGRPVKGPLSPTCHRDGTVTYWSIYRQQWVREWALPDEEFAALGDKDRGRVFRHLRITA